MKTVAKIASRLLVLLFIAAAAAVLYLDLKGFPPALKARIEKQFLRAGYAVRFSSLRLDVLRGVVARDAVVADAKAPQQPLARIDEVQLVWNWPRMLRREFAIGALRIANATISVPTPADEIGPEHFAAREAYATVRFLDDGSTEIDQLSGVYCGIRVQVSGQIKTQTAVGPSAPAQKPSAEKSQFAFITKALRELNSLKIESPPQLDVDFTVDLARPLDSRVHARLVGLDFGYRNVPVHRASVDVKMEEGAIDLGDCRVEIGTGALSIRGRYDIAMGLFDLRLSSSLDPAMVARALPEEAARGVRDLQVSENPKIEARYFLSPETGTLPRLQGTVQVGTMEYRGVPFRAINFAFENQGPLVKIADARIVTPEGQLTGHGQFHIEKSDFTYEFDSTVDPRKLLPLMTPVMRQIVEPSWFETPPHIVASVSGDFVDPDAFAYDAELTTERCSYRGVALASVSATLQLRHSRLNVPRMVLTRDEGDLRGSLLADFNMHQMQFDLATTANPTGMSPLLGPKAAELMRSYRFGPRTSGFGKGLVDFDVPARSAWTAQIANDGFSYWKLTADRAQATLTLTNNVLSIDELDGDVCGGKLRGRATFELGDTHNYRFDFTTERCDLQRLLADIRGKTVQTAGLLTGHCVLSGQGTDLATLRGKGNLEITDGVLWEAPLFGVFSSILNEIGPGLGSSKATKAKATVTIDNSAAKSDDIEVAAGAFTLTSSGKIGFDGKLDFRVKGQLLRSLPGVNFLTWFLSNVFEYKIGGTLSNPNYRPTNVPKELFPHGDLGGKDKNGAN